MVVWCAPGKIAKVKVPMVIITGGYPELFVKYMENNYATNLKCNVLKMYVDLMDFSYEHDWMEYNKVRT